VKRLLMCAGCLALSGCLLGCATALTNHGEVGLRYGTELTFFSRASKTADITATAEIEVPALIDWLFTTKEEADEVVPDPVAVPVP